LLVVSAFLKLHQLLTMTPNGPDGLLMSPRVGWLAAGWEAALALWLWSGDRLTSCRRAAMVTFAVFAAVSLLQALQGNRTCACFGVIEAAPWFVFAMDVGILIWIWRTPPDIGARQIRKPAMRAVTAVLVVACLAAAWHQPAPSALRVVGWPDSPVLVSHGETAQWEFQLRNVGNDDVRITRATTSCECFVLELPAKHLPAGASVAGVALVHGDRFSNAAGTIELKARLEFDAGSGLNSVVLVRDLRVAPVGQDANSPDRRTP
jgi:hypothetical protein